MQNDPGLKQIAIIGGGPAGMFMYKRLVESGEHDLVISIFEKDGQLGPGMPYSAAGARTEHITNVSDNEIPEITGSIQEWVNKVSPEVLKPFNITAANFNEYKVLPRLLFGQYLASQFTQLQKTANQQGIETRLIQGVVVNDIKDDPATKTVTVYTSQHETYQFNQVVICTGHSWPKKQEDKIPNWFDSPYPPAKLAQKINFPVAIRGASLTAIDAVRTLARENGKFIKNSDGSIKYELRQSCEGFKIVLHSLNGLLPAIRFHLKDSHLSPGTAFKEEDVHAIMKQNNGFVPLDAIFEKVFKEGIAAGNPDFYEEIKAMSLEQFVDHMMNFRESLDPFLLFKAEYAEAERSIKRHQSVYWKEMLAVLSYAMNYPAKHLSAEDMLRLKKVLMPLISIVIAFVPQSSCRELIALHDAGILSVQSVDRESNVEPATAGGAIYHYKDENDTAQTTTYKMFVDAIGQAPVPYKDFPFQSLKENGTVSEAFLRFSNAENGKKEKQHGNDDILIIESDAVYLRVPGININDHFQVLDKFGVYNERLYVMAVPLIAGLNPDYSGLDFCEAASKKILHAMMANNGQEKQYSV